MEDAHAKEVAEVCQWMSRLMVRYVQGSASSGSSMKIVLGGHRCWRTSLWMPRWAFPATKCSRYAAACKRCWRHPANGACVLRGSFSFLQARAVHGRNELAPDEGTTLRHVCILFVVPSCLLKCWWCKQALRSGSSC